MINAAQSWPYWSRDSSCVSKPTSLGVSGAASVAGRQSPVPERSHEHSGTLGGPRHAYSLKVMLLGLPSDLSQESLS